MNQSMFVPSNINVREWIYWIREAGKLALIHRRHLEKSYENDTILTSADVAVQKFLIQKIQERFPGDAILAEGYSCEKYSDKKRTWILDPIDGTRAYASALPFWGISLGLLDQSQVTFGVFYMPAVRELYLGVNGHAYLNNKRLSPVSAKVKEDASTFLAVPSKVYREYEITYPRIRSFGSMATHLAYVARGIAVGALTRRFYLWDVAGILPVLNATGIKISHLNGDGFDPTQWLGATPVSSECIVCHPAVEEHIREKIKHHKVDA